MGEQASLLAQSDDHALTGSKLAGRPAVDEHRCRHVCGVSLDLDVASTRDDLFFAQFPFVEPDVKVLLAGGGRLEAAVSTAPCTACRG